MLCREDGIWLPDLYSHYDKDTDLHFSFGRALEADDIIPYKGNEHLHGTDGEPTDEEVIALKKGDWVFSLTDRWENFTQYRLCRLSGIMQDAFLISDRYLTPLIVRFRDFDPDNKEKTRKALLTVRGGKVERYDKS